MLCLITFISKADADRIWDWKGEKTGIHGQPKHMLCIVSHCLGTSLNSNFFF